MKKSGFPWTIVFLVAVAGFAAWVYFSAYKGGLEKEKATEDAKALLPFSVSNVTEFQIRFKPPNDTLNILSIESFAKKVGEEWRVEKPFSDLGDARAIETFLSTVSTEKFTETVVEGPDIFWKTYGLDQPVVDALFIGKNEAGAEVKRTVQIGSVLGMESTVFVRLDQENRVVSMSSTARAALQRDPRDLRDKHFFPAKVPPLFKSLEIARVGFPKLEFVKEKDVWVQKAKEKDHWPLDQRVIKSYVDSVASLRGNDVWAEDRKDPKVLRMRRLDRPGIEISLVTEKDEKLSLKIASLEKEQSVAAGFGSSRPLVFSVYKAQLETISKTIDDFRDLKFPFTFKVADVTAIELERPAGSVSLPILVKREGKWMVDPMDTRFPGREVLSELVDRLMVEVNSLSALKMLPGGAPQPKLGPKGSLRIGFFAEKNRKLAEYVFNVNGEVVQVSSSVTPNKVFQIEKALLDALTLDVLKEKGLK